MTPGFCVRKWHSWTTQIGTRGLSPTLRGSSAWRTAVVENSDDPIISCLSCALLAAERGNDQYCADACGLPSPSGACVCGQKFELLSNRLE